MNTYRQNALGAGVLFVIADIVGPLAYPALAFLFDRAPDYLATAATHSSQVVSGVLLILTMELACSGIAVWLYPVLRRHHEALALWAVGLRAVEAVCGIVAGVALLALIPLGRAFLAAGRRRPPIFKPWAP